MTLPQPLALILPLIVTPLAGWLGDDGLPRWLNECIALIVLVAAVVAWMLIGGKISPDITADVAIIAGYTAALMAGPLAPLRAWMMAQIPSPFLLFKKPSRPAPISGGRTSQAMVPGNASAQPTAPTAVISAVKAQSSAAPQSLDPTHGG